MTPRTGAKKIFFCASRLPSQLPRLLKEVFRISLKRLGEVSVGHLAKLLLIRVNLVGYRVVLGLKGVVMKAGGMRG